MLGASSCRNGTSLYAYYYNTFRAILQGADGIFLQICKIAQKLRKLCYVY